MRALLLFFFVLAIGCTPDRGPGVLCSTDGRRFAKRGLLEDRGLSPRCAWASTDDVFVGGLHQGNRALVLHSRDHGKLWDYEPVSSEGWVYALAGRSSTDLYAVGEYLAAHRDAGGWHLLAPEMQKESFFSAWAAPDGRIWLGGSRAIWHSADGRTWDRTPTPGPVAAIGGAPGDLYAGGSWGALHSTDGRTFQPVDVHDHITAVGPGGWLGTGGPVLYHFDGKAFQRVLVGGVTGGVTGFRVKGDQIVVGFKAGFVATSPDGGRSFETVSADPADFYEYPAFAVSPSGDIWLAGALRQSSHGNIK